MRSLTLISISQVSTMIIGASKPEQVIENLGALDIIPKVTDEIYQQIDEIFAFQA
jgi:aryl-alcohol dehydrogenase-like predicted oxidoreductase